MIIDADTHIAPSGGEFGLERHMEEMVRAGIDKTVTWLQPGYEGREIEKYNAYVFDAGRRYPNHILGFGWADPTVGVEHAKDMVKKCIGEYGFYGVKLNGAQNDYFIDDPSLSLPVIEEIAKTGKPLAFHIGPDDPFRSMHVALATYKAVLGRAVLNGEITQNQEELILGGNIAHLFGLEQN